MFEKFDDSTNQVFGHAIPDLERIWGLGFPLTPTGASIPFLDDPESEIPMAAQCLDDALEMLCEARYALLQAFTQVAHYRQKKPKPNDGAAEFFGKFYAADVSLRLYAAAQHLEQGIVAMLGLDKKTLKRSRKKDRNSLWSAVADYLRSEIPSHPVSVAVAKLYSSKEWGKTIGYRNDWVHSQPPLVGGIGLVFKRGKKRWRKHEQDGQTAYILTGGGGDQPELSLDDLLEFVRAASCKFTDAMVIVCGWYVNLVGQARYRFGGEPADDTISSL